MYLLTILASAVLGIAAALGAGALSGLKLGADALGRELAAWMGALYGLIAGAVAVGFGLAASVMH